MKIILTCNYSPWSPYSGGGQRSTHMLATSLSRRGHEVTTVFTKPPWESFPVPGDLEYRVRWAPFAAIRSRRAAIARPLNGLFVAREVSRLLGDREAPIVHCQGEEGAAIPLLRRRLGLTFPLVITPRYPSYPQALTDPSRRTFYRALSKVRDPKFAFLEMILRRADQVCPTSEHSMRQVQAAFQIFGDNFTVVPNGLDPAFFASTRDRSASRGPVVFFGRLARSKGVHELAEALLRLEDSDLRAVFIGRGDELPTLRTCFAGSSMESRVEFVDWMSSADLARVLSTASMAVLPSHEESFGNTMAESMAAGVPLISTTAGSIPEVVQHGVTGILVPPCDPEALCAAMRSLLGSVAMRESLGNAAREFSSRKYSWDSTAARFEKIYLSVRP